MSEQLRDVRIRMNAEMGNTKGFAAFQKQAADLATRFEKMVGTLRTLGGVAEKEADRAARAWDRFGKAVEKAGRAGALSIAAQSGGGGGMGGSLMGMVPAGAMRYIAPAAIASGAASIGGDILGGFHARSAGVDLQRSDLGFVSRFLVGIRDTLTGRDIYQRAQDLRMERQQQRTESESSLRAGIMQRRFQMDDLNRLNVMHPDIMGIRPQEEIGRIGRQLPGLGREAAALDEMRRLGGNRAVDMMNNPWWRRPRNWRENLQEVPLGPGQGPQRIGIPAEQIQRAFDDARLSGEGLSRVYARHNELLREQLNLAKSISQAQVNRIAGLRDEFAMMDPLQRERAEMLAQKIKAGGLLEHGEFQEGIGLPGVRDVILRRQREEDERTGAFNQFLGAVGRPEDLAILQRAQARGLQVEVAIAVDSKSVEEAIKNAMRDLNARIDALAVNQANLGRDRDEFERKLRQNRDAANGGPR